LLETKRVCYGRLDPSSVLLTLTQNKSPARNLAAKLARFKMPEPAAKQATFKVGALCGLGEALHQFSPRAATWFLVNHTWNSFPSISENAAIADQYSRLCIASIPVNNSNEAPTAEQTTLALDKTKTARSCTLKSGRRHIGQAVW
jgi:hypothetical protein